MTKVASVILAGGSGQRFWPLSTSERPKQFLDLEGCGRSLLQATYDRLLGVSGGHQGIFVVTASRYESLVRDELPSLPLDHVLVEPVGRDTAAAVGLAALEVRARMGDAVMGVFPSDHRVQDVEAFARAVEEGAALADHTRGIVTLGMAPDRPATGYGYIELGAPEGKGYRVQRFVEKPDATTAATFLESGTFAWNAGIFLFHATTLLAEMARHAPDILEPLEAAFEADTVRHAYGRVPKRSLDYAVMEHTRLAYVLPASFGWDDLGDWAALERIRRHDGGIPNTVVGRHVGIETDGSIIYNHDDDGVIATLGVHDMVVVRRGGTVLLVAKDRVQDLKRLTEEPDLLDLDLPSLGGAAEAAKA